MDQADADLTNAACDADAATAGDQCTLRAAIQEANDTSGADTIGFDIPGSGVQTIAPASGLPTVTGPVTIDGTTQPGFSGSPVIELNGSGAGAGVDGLAISAGNSTVRGLVINRFSQHGIMLQTGGGNTVVGNYIGTDAAGTASLGNGFSGVRVDMSDDNTIGGTSAADGNVISGNYEGIRLRFTTESVVRGNRIGTDATGAGALGNFSTGVLLDSASGCAIGGTAAGAGNTIAFNGSWSPNGGGVVVLSNAYNSILSNSVFSNDGLGIDLSSNFPLDGVTPNDPDDGDFGPNQRQNFPVLGSATDIGGSTTIEGTLGSTPDGNFVVQFFSSPEADPSGNGEGKTYLGQTGVITDASGDASFTFATPDAEVGEVVTATATGVSETGTPFFSTSEFSRAVAVDVAPTVEGVTTPKRRGANITARFSEPMDASTLMQAPDAQPSASETVVLLKGGAASATRVLARVSCADASCETVTLNPDRRLTKRTKYTVRIEGAADGDGRAVEDVAGNELAQDHVRFFRTRDR